VYRILIFAKAPVPGQVKTRLAPLLGFEGAAALARQMLEQTCIEAQAVPGAAVELCTSPAPSDPSWSALLDGNVATSAQGHGDLGERLERAAARVIAEGHKPILIGTDCPALDRRRLSAACRMLDDNDAFLHPTEDGGYALLALKRFSARLFSNIPWSGPEVASRTVARLQELGWRYALGDVLRDVDEPADCQALFPPASPSQNHF
jgi:rSAM/selenodomain-associated transferase 1